MLAKEIVGRCTAALTTSGTAVGNADIEVLAKLYMQAAKGNLAGTANLIKYIQRVLNKPDEASSEVRVESHPDIETGGRRKGRD